MKTRSKKAEKKGALPQAIEEKKRVIEALLFAAAGPLAIAKIQEILTEEFPITSHEIKGVIDQLKGEYSQEGRSFELHEMALGFLIRSKETYASYIQKLRGKREEKLSRAASEILAIIAHLQPVTRGQIEKIRGVDSSGSLLALQERGLIDIVGRLETPGRPAQYAITREFLTHFGLRDITELQERLSGPSHGSDSGQSPKR